MEVKKLNPLQRFIRLVTLERKDILQVFYYAVFSGIVSLSLPLGIQAIINLIQGAQISTSFVVLVILVALGVVFVGILQLMQIRIIEVLQQRIFMRSALEFSYRFPKIETSELYNEYTPELANRFFDTLTIQKSLSKILLDIPTALLQIFFSLILLSFYHPFFIFFGIAIFVLLFSVFKFSAKKGLETSLQESTEKYKIAHWIQEIARNVVSFKSAGEDSLAVQKSDEMVEKYLQARESHFRVLFFQFSLLIAFKVIVTAGFLIVGGLLVINQQMNIGQFVAAEIIIILVMASVEKLIKRLETFYDILTSVEKMGQVVDKQLESNNGVKPTFFEKGISLELNDIEFTIPNRKKPILKDINLVIPAGSRMLIKGGNGAGKSTLLRVIAGIYTPTYGTLYANEIALNGWNMDHYRSLLGVSLPEETLFEGTIRENITFGNTLLEDREILEVTDKLGLKQYLKDLPEHLNTKVITNDKKISETIAKKILLARAILKRPKILILEDSLDNFSEKEAEQIMHYLTETNKNWSLVVVSHKKNWEKFCDTIVELKEGNLINK